VLRHVNAQLPAARELITETRTGRIDSCKQVIAVTARLLRAISPVSA
jgi:hypothetical protein